jgi:hypothetical protein
LAREPFFSYVLIFSCSSTLNSLIIMSCVGLFRVLVRVGRAASPVFCLMLLVSETSRVDWRDVLGLRAGVLLALEDILGAWLPCLQWFED